MHKSAENAFVFKNFIIFLKKVLLFSNKCVIIAIIEFVCKRIRVFYGGYFNADL